MNAPQPKYCVHCVHVQDAQSPHPACGRDGLPRSLVTGLAITPCFRERDSSAPAACGRDAQHFVSRPLMRQRPYVPAPATPDQSLEQRP